MTTTKTHTVKKTPFKSLLFSSALILSGFFQVYSQNTELPLEETFNDVRWFDTMDKEKKAMKGAWLKATMDTSIMQVCKLSYNKLDSTEKWEECDVLYMDTYALSDKWETALTENKNQPFAPLLQLDKSRVKLLIHKNRKIYISIELRNASNKWMVESGGALNKKETEILGDILFNKNRPLHVVINKDFKKYFWVENGGFLTFSYMEKRPLWNALMAEKARLKYSVGGDLPDYPIH